MRYLIGLNANEDEMGTKTIHMLSSIVDNGGNLHSAAAEPTCQMGAGDACALRLAAGAGIAKLATQRVFQSIMPPSTLRTLTLLVVDDSAQVRERFVHKLNEHLNRLRVPLEFMAVLSVAPLLQPVEAMSALVNTVEHALVTNIQRRREYLRNITEQQSMYAHAPCSHICRMGAFVFA